MKFEQEDDGHYKMNINEGNSKDQEQNQMWQKKVNKIIKACYKLEWNKESDSEKKKDTNHKKINEKNHEML